MVLVQPCVKYESKLDTSKVTTVKLDKTENGAKRSKYCSQFTASMGVEGLIYVIDQFNKNADKLNLTIGEKWNNSDEVLDAVAESKWTSQIINIAPQARNEIYFTTQLNILIGSYAKNVNPTDVLIKYLKGLNGKKPYAKTPQEHANGMEVLICIANRLSGTEQNMDEANKKKIIFESFRDDWQTDFKKSGNTVATSSLTQIIGYMNLCKSVLDSRLDNNKKKTERIRRVDTCNCSTCQKYKQQGRAHDYLPEREAISLLFEEAHVDLIGPWKVTVADQEIEVLALTYIEPVTNLVEQIRISNKTPEHVSQQFENCWLSQYPWPAMIVHDNGGEFTGYAFQQLLEKANIKINPNISIHPYC